MNTLPTQNNSVLKTVSILIGGILIGILFFFALVFKMDFANLKVYYGERDKAKTTENSILMEGVLKEDYNSYTSPEIQVLRKSFEDSVKAMVQLDTKFVKSGPNLSPIDDRFVLAARMMLYYKLKEANNGLRNRADLLVQNEIYDKNSWVWISKKDLLAYASALITAPEQDSIDGCRIYFGTIDKRYLDEAHYAKNKEYYDAKNGALIPYFVTTNHKNGELTDDPTRPRYDCNCGNPPGSVNCEVGGQSSRSYRCNDREIQQGSNCARCANP